MDNCYNCEEWIEEVKPRPLKNIVRDDSMTVKMKAEITLPESTELTDDYIAKLNELENRWQNEDEDDARILYGVMTGKVKDDD